MKGGLLIYSFVVDFIGRYKNEGGLIMNIYIVSFAVLVILIVVILIFKAIKARKQSLAQNYYSQNPTKPKKAHRYTSRKSDTDTLMDPFLSSSHSNHHGSHHSCSGHSCSGHSSSSSCSSSSCSGGGCGGGCGG